jgi:membrane protease YdiL (CAAX protease family)
VSDSGTPQRRVRWYDLITPQAAGMIASLVLVIAALVIWAGQGGYMAAVAHLQRSLGNFLEQNLLLDLSNLFTFGAALWVVSRVTDPGLPARFRPLTRNGALLGLAAGICAVIVSATVEYLSDHYLHTDLGREGLATAVLPHRADQLALGLFTVAILAPLTEEIYFRGIVMGWLRRHWGMIWAVGLSSLVFALLHLKWLTPGGLGGWVVTAELVAMGVLLALVAARTGSLWASFITHAVNNFCAALVAVFLSH